jgi:hypothetical protein
MAKKGKIVSGMEKLGELVESLKRQPSLEVGVLGNKSARSQTTGKWNGVTNADLACAHEYGVPQHGLPPRSILRTPLHDHRDRILGSVKGMAEKLLDKQGTRAIWNRVGVECIAVIEEAFATGGFGKWVSLKTATIMRKLKGSLRKRKAQLAQVYAGQVGEGILIDRGELRRSFSWRVKFKF